MVERKALEAEPALICGRGKKEEFR